MSDEKKRICFIGANPYFEGGMGLYQKNLIEYLKKNNKNMDITVVYFGKEEKNSDVEGIKYIQIKNKFPYPLDQIVDNFKILNYLKKNKFDIINSHALWGYWMKFYKKQAGQKLVHTYHGVTYNYFKVHLRRFSFIKRLILSPLLLFSYLIEKPPMKNADEIICVSEKVRRQLSELYNSKRDMEVIRTGVNLDEFKIRNKKLVKENLNLDDKKMYGLYVGKGGYWIKGLDRAINISQNIYKINKDYKLIVVGAEYKKIKQLIDKEFIIYIEKVPREKIPYYYNAADFLFYLSRYDGGAPTLVVSEGMASGGLVIFSEDSEQEIIEDGKNGIIVSAFDNKNANKIIETVTDKDKRNRIIKDSIKTVHNFSLKNWGEEYYNIIKK